MDIVKRLRFFAPKSVADLYSQPEQVMSDAADEIERLRKQNQTQALDHSASEGWWWDLIGKKVAEIERLREALKEILAHETDYEPYDCIEIARAALKEGE